MDGQKVKNIHLRISLALFLISLALPGYYIREMYEPQPSLPLLMMGWLGPLDGNFSWFANVFYFIALIKRDKPGKSSFFGFIALLFALSFLGYEKIIVSEAPSYASITAYGLGYTLWVMSIGTLSLGQYCLSVNTSTKVSIKLLSGWFVIVISMYGAHYFVGEASLYSINVSRDSIFEEKCRSSGQKIYRKVNDATGVYVNPDGGVRFKRYSFGDWYTDGGGVQGVSYVNSGHLLFYERNDDRAEHEKLKYRRFKLRDHRGIAVESLNSEYAILTNHFDIPKKLGIRGAEIVIKDLRNDRILATSSYVHDRIGKGFCGHAPKGRFSVTSFAIDVLNLTKKFPSGYDDK